MSNPFHLPGLTLFASPPTFLEPEARSPLVHMKECCHALHLALTPTALALDRTGRQGQVGAMLLRGLRTVIGSHASGVISKASRPRYTSATTVLFPKVASVLGGLFDPGVESGIITSRPVRGAMNGSSSNVHCASHACWTGAMEQGNRKQQMRLVMDVASTLQPLFFQGCFRFESARYEGEAGFIGQCLESSITQYTIPT